MSPAAKKTLLATCVFAVLLGVKPAVRFDNSFGSGVDFVKVADELNRSAELMSINPDLRFIRLSAEDAGKQGSLIPEHMRQSLDTSALAELSYVGDELVVYDKGAMIRTAERAVKYWRNLEARGYVTAEGAQRSVSLLNNFVEPIKAGENDIPGFKGRLDHTKDECGVFLGYPMEDVFLFKSVRSKLGQRMLQMKAVKFGSDDERGDSTIYWSHASVLGQTKKILEYSRVFQVADEVLRDSFDKNERFKLQMEAIKIPSSRFRRQFEIDSTDEVDDEQWQGIYLKKAGDEGARTAEAASRFAAGDEMEVMEYPDAGSEEAGVLAAYVNELDGALQAFGAWTPENAERAFWETTQEIVAQFNEVAGVEAANALKVGGFFHMESAAGALRELVRRMDGADQSLMDEIEEAMGQRRALSDAQTEEADRNESDFYAGKADALESLSVKLLYHLIDYVPADNAEMMLPFLRGLFRLSSGERDGFLKRVSNLRGRLRFISQWDFAHRFESDGVYPSRFLVLRGYNSETSERYEPGKPAQLPQPVFFATDTHYALSHGGSTMKGTMRVLAAQVPLQSIEQTFWLYFARRKSFEPEIEVVGQLRPRHVFEFSDLDEVKRFISFRNQYSVQMLALEERAGGMEFRRSDLVWPNLNHLIALTANHQLRVEAGDVLRRVDYNHFKTILSGPVKSSSEEELLTLAEGMIDRVLSSNQKDAQAFLNQKFQEATGSRTAEQLNLLDRFAIPDGFAAHANVTQADLPAFRRRTRLLHGLKSANLNGDVPLEISPREYLIIRLKENEYVVTNPQGDEIRFRLEFSQLARSAALEKAKQAVIPSMLRQKAFGEGASLMDYSRTPDEGALGRLMQSLSRVFGRIHRKGKPVHFAVHAEDDVAAGLEEALAGMNHPEGLITCAVHIYDGDLPEIKKGVGVVNIVFAEKNLKEMPTDISLWSVAGMDSGQAPHLMAAIIGAMILTGVERKFSSDFQTAGERMRSGVYMAKRPSIDHLKALYNHEGAETLKLIVEVSLPGFKLSVVLEAANRIAGSIDWGA